MTQIGRSSRRLDVAVPDADGARVTLAWAALSDRGYRRAVNEDSLIAKSPIFCVADGMGGHAAGDVASAAVVARLAEHVGADFVVDDDIVGALRQAVADMTHEVGESDLGTGTTATGIALTLHHGVPHWLVFNIGDSRVYQLHEHVLTQLTVDHSLVQRLIDAGKISVAEAEVHPNSNVITRAVGFNEDPTPDFWVLPMVPGSRMLVCSDGLTKELTTHGIRYFMEQGATAADAAGRLMDAALGNGGRDNVSVIVVDVLGTPERPAKGPRRGSGPRTSAGVRTRGSAAAASAAAADETEDDQR